MIGYSKIEDKPEEEENTDETFFSEFYKEWYHQDPFEMHLLEAIRVQSIHSKSQELAEIANKKKDECTVEEIVPAYVLKCFAKVFNQEASQQLPKHLQ